MMLLLITMGSMMVTVIKISVSVYMSLDAIIKSS